MKKLLLSVALLMAGFVVSAQTAEELQASSDRMAKLEKLAQPKNCGLVNVDQLTSEAGKAAAESLLISPILHKLHQRIETKDIDAQLIQELTVLSKRISDQATSIKHVAELVPAASQEISKIKNPLKLKEPTKAISYSKDVVAIVGEETTFQTKTIAAMIQKAAAQ